MIQTWRSTPQLTVDEPPLAIPNLDTQLEELRVARERATRALQERYDHAMDGGDFDAADFYDEPT